MENLMNEENEWIMIQEVSSSVQEGPANTIPGVIAALKKDEKA